MADRTTSTKKGHLQVAYKRLTSEIKTHKNKVRGCKKLFHINGNNEKARVAIRITDKIDFISKSITKTQGII